MNRDRGIGVGLFQVWDLCDLGAGVGLKAQRECPHSLHSPFISEPDAPHPPPSPVTHELKEGETSMAPEAPPVPFALPPSSASSLGSGAPLPAEVGVQLELTGTLQVAQQSQPMAR